MLDELRIARRTAIDRVLTDITPDQLDAIKLSWAKSHVARNYLKSIAADVAPGVEVIWGCGGAQSKRIAECVERGVEWCHVD